MIKVRNLTKKYKKITAVDNISFSVAKGTIFAFLGPNGAGKSTTIKMLTTVTSPTSGEIEINGFNALKQKNSVRKSIGVIFQDPSLDENLTAFENMEYHAVFYKVKDKKPKIKKLLKYVELIDRKNSLVKTFSGGMKRRLEIARGLLHSPEILFLDEPTSGLDAQTKNFFWKHLEKLNKEENLTIFLTTHNLDEAEQTADVIAIMDKGKILKIGTLEEIKRDTNTDSLEKAFLEITGYEIRSEQADPKDEMRKFHK